MNKVSFLKVHKVLFAITFSVYLNNSSQAIETNIDSSSQSISLKDEPSDYGSRLVGLGRIKVIELLGTPRRSEEFFPYTNHSTLVDYYAPKINSAMQLRVTYDKNSNVSATEFEQSPQAIPRFMGEAANNVNLSDTKLRDFLNTMPQVRLRNMSAKQISAKLGKPDRSWHETSRAGGRIWNFLNYLYYLSPDGRKAFIVMFNQANGSVYEYRLQSISNQ